MELSNQDFDALSSWLLGHFDADELRKLSRLATSNLDDVLQHLPQNTRAPTKQELAESLIRRFDAELLADEDRRRLVTRAWNRRKGTKLRIPAKWFRGGPRSHEFVRELGLPKVLAGARGEAVAPWEDIDAYPPLGDLHSYQKDLYERIRSVLCAKGWAKRRGLVWLPTGTGKTRVLVEALLRECKLTGERNVVLWIADRGELCEQAVEAFRHVWLSVGWERGRHEDVGVPNLRLIRYWGGRQYMVPPAQPTVIVASIQKLARGLMDGDEPDIVFEEELAILGERCAAIVFDEAHHVVAPTYNRVMRALGLTRQKNWYGNNHRTAPPLFGLTATPARKSRDETERLSRQFRGQLIEPTSRNFRSLGGFVRGGFLSAQRIETVDTGYELTMVGREKEQWERFKTLPRNALSRAGQDPLRTANIVREMLERTAKQKSVLVFACSVEHAMTMADCLRHLGEKAIGIHGGMSKPIRQAAIRSFRQRQVKYLVNCDLLTTGFDAPEIDTIVLARPIDSPVLFAQMIGRGLRGPANGGTASCLILDCVDSTGPYGALDELRRLFRDQFLEHA